MISGRFIVVAGLLTASLVSAQEAAAPIDPTKLTNPRSLFKSSISLELGANSLASVFGFTGGYWWTPQNQVEVGYGFSVNGKRFGVRATRLLQNKKFSPYVSGTLKMGLGSNGYNTVTIKVNNDPEKEIDVKAEPTAFLDAGIGFDFVGTSGFAWRAGTGYSLALSSDNYSIHPYSPELSSSEKKLVDVLYGSGLTVATSIGYAF
jgi:hypothetical protein